MKAKYQEAGLPVIRVDTKKKEKIVNSKTQGMCGERKSNQ
jgi:hypothetical protein